MPPTRACGGPRETRTPAVQIKSLLCWPLHYRPTMKVESVRLYLVIFSSSVVGYLTWCPEEKSNLQPSLS